MNWKRNITQKSNGEHKIPLIFFYLPNEVHSFFPGHRVPSSVPIPLRNPNLAPQGTELGETTRHTRVSLLL